MKAQIDPASGALVQPASLYNTNPLNYYVTGLERTQATSLGNFKINDHAEAYAELFYTNSKVAWSTRARAARSTGPRRIPPAPCRTCAA